MWKVENNRPKLDGYYWITLDTGTVEIAYYSGFNDSFIVAETVGDTEGLNTEYYTNVLAWDDIIRPEPAAIDPQARIML